MTQRLEVENAELAAAFRGAASHVRRRLALRMVERALGAQEPPLEVPDDLPGREALAARLDSSDDEADFRRARAAAAAVFLRRGAYEDAFYEALHARADPPAAVQEAIALTR